MPSGLLKAFRSNPHKIITPPAHVDLESNKATSTSYLGPEYQSSSLIGSQGKSFESSSLFRGLLRRSRNNLSITLDASPSIITDGVSSAEILRSAASDNASARTPTASPLTAEDTTRSRHSPALRSRNQAALRTAYNGFKMILEVAAESAEAFPLLKSVLGGLRAVLKASEASSQVQK